MVLRLKMFSVQAVTFTCLALALMSGMLVASTKCSADEQSFINVCGKCVGGATGFSESEGRDECGVCFGSNSCKKCRNTQTEACKIDKFYQKVDLALSATTAKLYLGGLKTVQIIQEELACSVEPENELSGNTSTFEAIPSTEENVPFIRVNKSLLKVGMYRIRCYRNTSRDLQFNSSVRVVDSRILEITSISPKSVPSNNYFELSVNISTPQNISENLLCFAKAKGQVENIVRATYIAPYTIKCEKMILPNTNAVSIGVSETMEAALDSSRDLNLKEISVYPSVPIVRRSTLSSDLRLTFVEFDQNIDPSKNCTKVFSAETISLFGSGWHCWIQANQLVVQLGTDPLIHPGSRISLLPSNEIQQTDSIESNVGIPQASTTVVDDITNQVVEPVYNVLAPNVACFGKSHTGFQSTLFDKKFRRDDLKADFTNKNEAVTTLEVQQLGGQNLRYNWSVTFNPSKNRRPMSQRDMLLTWLSVRLLDKSLRSVTANRVSLNNTLMLSNVDYTVTVRGTNALGMSGEEKRIPLRLQNTSPLAEHRSESSEMMMNVCTSNTPLDVMISSPPAIFSDTEFRVELTTSCCDGTIMPEVLGQIGYKWSVKSEDGSNIKFGHYWGKHLFIPPGTLQGGKGYEITCNLFHKAKNTPIGSAKINLKTLERGIQINVNVSGVGISTSHPLILDASASKDFDKLGKLEFEWTCRMVNSGHGDFGYGDNKCYVPNKEKTLLHDYYSEAFTKPILYLPPESLPIGRYHISVKVSRSSSDKTKISNVMTTEVSIFGGSPPLVYIPTRNSAGTDSTFLNVINPEDGTTLTGLVQGIKTGCRISWRSVDVPGYITLNNSFLHQEPYIAVADDDKTREFSVELSPGLMGDAKYRLRLSAMCPFSEGIETAYADVDVLTDAPPVLKALQVEPLEGEALVTEFIFSTEPAYDDLLDYPLRYYFGFQIQDDANNAHSTAKFFHSSSQKLSAATYLPALSLKTTKIQSILKVCDVRHICHSIDGPLLLSHAPERLTTEHVELLSEGFASFLLAEEYEDAIMLVESSMVTLEVLDDKSLYQLASKNVERAVNDQLDLLEKRLESSPEEVNAALRFLKAANTALKHGAFSQETLQRLVAFKDKILSMLSDETKTLPGYQNDSRRKRQATNADIEQSRNVLQPEMVRTLLSVSEVAIFNLSDTSKALNEKRKLLQNVSFFMDSLCRSLRNAVPIFIGSRVVSFSVQRLNMQVKYKDDLAIPDWRSAKSGGAPVNATALIRLGEDTRQLFDGNIICMGAAYYPMDFLAEVAGVSIPGLYRHSSVYQVKIIKNTSQKVTAVDNYEGLNIKTQTVRVKIPIWNERIGSGMQLKCGIWLNDTWDCDSCKIIKLATLINKPAVECLCSVVGFYAVFVTELPTTSQPSTTRTTTTQSVEVPISSTQWTDAPTIAPVSQTMPPQTTTLIQAPTKVELTTKLSQEPVSNKPPIKFPPGVPIPNSSQNFTFSIREDFSAIVGSKQAAFISQLKQDILKQVDMPANMIASIDVAPGSILVTLHLVDTDIRTVDDVLPSLAAVLQEGRLSVNGLDGQHLSVPPQSLKLLQRRIEHSFVPWIIVGCTGFGLFSIGSLIIAAIIVKRQFREGDFTKVADSQEMNLKPPAYGHFHLEQTLDGSEATLSRYRSSVKNPLVISTIGGMASVMGTNALLSTDAVSTAAHFKLQPPQSECKISAMPLSTRSSTNPNNSHSGSGTTSGSSGSSSISSIQKRVRNGSVLKPILLPEDEEPIVSYENGGDNECEPEEEDSGIVVVNGKPLAMQPNNSTSQTPNICVQQPPDVVILPGTPTGRTHQGLSQTIDKLATSL